ncbi:MAG: orotidine-5'-phosphate decarboxylase [Terrimesophilobacter sp.]
MAESSFGERLSVTVSARGSLCVGIDPHPFLLSSWGLPDSAEGLKAFGLAVVAAAAGRVGIVKPQVAFFERHGSRGFAALENVLQAAREAGLLVIADAKRGDLGTSVEAYGQAWLTPGGPLEADAMTVNAYQGVDSLSDTIALARHAGKGLFVLAATSNPEAAATQTARIVSGGRAGLSVAAGIVDEVIALNSSDKTGWGSFGVVLGATVTAADYGISLDSLAGPSGTPILAPGFGHQGAAFAHIPTLYGAAAPFVLAATSRAVLSAGRDGIESAIERAAEELAKCRA